MPKRPDKRRTDGVSRDDRKERLAINLFDLERIDQTIRPIVLAGRLDLRGTVHVDKNRIDEIAVEMTPPLLSSAALIDVLRSKDRQQNRYPIRCYIKRASRWEKVPGRVRLTVVVGKDVILNPDVFPLVVEGTYFDTPTITVGEEM